MNLEEKQDEFFRCDAAAKYINQSASTMAKMRMRGDGPPYIKFSKVIIYSRRDLDTWMYSKRRQSTSQR